MAENYNKEHAASLEFVQNAVVDAYEKMQVWMTTHVDNLDYVQRIIAKLREAYRGGTWTSAMAYADAIDQCVKDMAAALQSAGANVGEKDLSEFCSTSIKLPACCPYKPVTLSVVLPHALVTYCVLPPLCCVGKPITNDWYGVMTATTTFCSGTAPLCCAL